MGGCEDDDFVGFKDGVVGDWVGSGIVAGYDCWVAVVGDDGSGVCSR